MTKPISYNGMSITKHPLYNTWVRIMHRCYDEKYKDYSNWGGRGIAVDKRWHSSLAFITDMAPTWKEGLSIDRIDNDGDYSPENCRWATATEQANNRRSNKFMILNGKPVSLHEAAAFLNIKYKTLLGQRFNGWSDSDIIQQKRRLNKTVKPIEYDSVKYTMQEIAIAQGIKYKTVKNRKKMGWTAEQILLGYAIRKPKVVSKPLLSNNLGV